MRKKCFPKIAAVIAASAMLMSTTSLTFADEIIVDADTEYQQEQTEESQGEIITPETEAIEEPVVQQEVEEEFNNEVSAPIENEENLVQTPIDEQITEETTEEEVLLEESTATSEAEAVEEVIPTIFDANGGSFSDGASSVSLTADEWLNVAGVFTNEDEAKEEPWTLINTPEGYQLRYVLMSVSYQTGDGESIVLTDAEGKILLDTTGNEDHLIMWKAVLTDSPQIEVKGDETPEGAFGYEIKWNAVFSHSGEGSYEEPKNEGYIFSGWFADQYGEVEWDGTSGSEAYARWIKDESDVQIKAADEDIEVIDVDEGNDDELFTDAGETNVPETTDDAYEQTTEENDNDDVANTSNEGSENAGTTAGTGTAPYTVKHMLMDTDGVNFTLKDTEHLTGTPGTQVSPTVKSYDGFTAPNMQTATIAADGTTEIEYRYTRKSYNYTLTQIEGADLNGSTPTGTRYFGEEIQLKCTPSAGYEFVQWSNGDTSAITSFTMPAEDVTIQPTVRVATYSITYDLDGGTASNPDSYTMQSDAFTLNAPTKEGAVFAGWTGANGDTPQVTVTVNKGTSGDLSFKANWTGSASTSAVSPVETPTPTPANNLANVQTGDTMMPLLYAGIAGTALVAILVVFFVSRKKKKQS